MINYDTLQTIAARLPTDDGFRAVTVYGLGVVTTTGEHLCLLALNDTVSVVLVEDVAYTVSSINYEELQAVRFRGELAIGIVDLLTLLSGALIQATPEHEIQDLIRTATKTFGSSILAVDAASTAHIAFVFDAAQHWGLIDTRVLLRELRIARDTFSEPARQQSLAAFVATIDTLLQGWPANDEPTVKQLLTLRDLTIRTVLAQAMLNAE